MLVSGYYHCSLFQYFQVRAYVYQARSLIGSDDSGLSDPFARIVIGEYCKTTQVCSLQYCKTVEKNKNLVR